MKKSTTLLIALLQLLYCYAQQPDKLEPNDKPDQAVAIDPFTTYLVSIFPNGDNDYFSFSLSSPMIVQPVAMEAKLPLNWDLFDEKGKLITNKFPYSAPAGNYLLRLTGYSSPDQFMIMLKCTPQTNGLQQGKGAAIIDSRDDGISIWWWIGGIFVLGAGYYFVWRSKNKAKEGLIPK